MTRTDSLLAHCVTRALVASGGTGRWNAMQAGTRGGRIAAFVIEWAAMQHDLERDDLSVEDYIEWSRAPRRSCYRRSAEYRELFPDVPVNELAAQLNRLVDDAESRPTLTTALAL